MAKRKHSFILRVCIISVLIVFIVAAISIKKVYTARKAEADEYKALITAQQADNGELQSAIDSKNKDEYIEKEAREKYGYIKPGDRVYQDSAAGE